MMHLEQKPSKISKTNDLYMESSNLFMFIYKREIFIKAMGPSRTLQCFHKSEEK